MEIEANTATVAASHGKGRAYHRHPRRAPEFPGCRPMVLRCDAVVAYEGRFEFWDAATETAWVACEPPDAGHEHPSQRLSALSEVLASVRGLPIECFGTMNLELHDEYGERRQILQADQSVYLYPARSRLPKKSMVLGEHDFPDVVVEVDQTTDVRRGKLWLYEEWGFPEVWVEVPDHSSPNRLTGRRSGLTIHLREDGAYRTARESYAFPGWTANEIHIAMNELKRSAITVRVLDRVGRTLSRRDSTRPDDTFRLRAQREESRDREQTEGRADGRSEILEVLKNKTAKMISKSAKNQNHIDNFDAAAPQSAFSLHQDAEIGTQCTMLGDLKTQQIYRGNFLEMAAQIPDRSVDLIIADPPYNASKGNLWSIKYGTLPGFGGDWKKISQVWDNMSLDEYLNFTLAWLSEAKRILKQTGSMWVHGTYHSTGITNVAMQMLQIEIINEIVWYKRNSFPNLSGRRLTASHETILWAHRGGKRSYRFNYNRSKSGDFSDDRLKIPNKQMRTVWDLPNNKSRYELEHGKHPAQKPVRLARRFIQLSAAPGDVCLVPFAGSGSECVAARAEGLRYIGFEIDAAYVKIARSRLKTDV